MVNSGRARGFTGIRPSILYSGPRGHIPIHNHFYVHTMYILSGRMEVTSYDPKTDEKVQEKITGLGDFIFNEPGEYWLVRTDDGYGLFAHVCHRL